MSAQRCLAKGLVAGLIGGLAAAAAKSIAGRLYPGGPGKMQEPAELIAGRDSVYSLSGGTRGNGDEETQWGYGAAVGAAYGALAEFYPAVTAKDGASFGIALMTLTHEASSQMKSLPASSEKESNREFTNEATTHLVFGVVTEAVRRFVRGVLG